MIKNPGNSGIFYFLKLRELNYLHLSSNPNFHCIQIMYSIPLCYFVTSLVPLCGKKNKP
jgi:hypothetical protein